MLSNPQDDEGNQILIISNYFRLKNSPHKSVLTTTVRLRALSHEMKACNLILSVYQLISLCYVDKFDINLLSSWGYIVCCRSCLVYFVNWSRLQIQYINEKNLLKVNDKTTRVTLIDVFLVSLLLTVISPQRFSNFFRGMEMKLRCEMG